MIDGHGLIALFALSVGSFISLRSQLGVCGVEIPFAMSHLIFRIKPSFKLSFRIKA